MTKQSATLTTTIPVLGEDAPAFVAQTTGGTIRFPQDYKGKWVILFSHPADFTPVCTSEIAAFAAMQDEFAALGAELIGLSVDSSSAHVAWLKEIEDKIRFGAYNGQPIRFPIIADVKMDVAKQYGMIQPSMSDTKTVRAVFIIDPKAKIRTILYYPQSTGRNFAEIKRIVQALQLTDVYGVATPADWQPGADVLVAAPADMQELKQRMADKDKLDCQDWFFCTRRSPEYLNS